MTRLAGSFM